MVENEKRRNKIKLVVVNHESYKFNYTNVFPSLA